uniref:ERAP1_C domain-containing protein n=1 Tax=Steinernema glaseri TaxID=37863 RepID=A0A1I8A0S7_9BILA
MPIWTKPSSSTSITCGDFIVSFGQERIQACLESLSKKRKTYKGGFPKAKTTNIATTWYVIDKALRTPGPLEKALRMVYFALAEKSSTEVTPAIERYLKSINMDRVLVLQKFLIEYLSDADVEENAVARLNASLVPFELKAANLKSVVPPGYHEFIGEINKWSMHTKRLLRELLGTPEAKHYAWTQGGLPS